jgi:hypothetical protein
VDIDGAGDTPRRDPGEHAIETALKGGEEVTDANKKRYVEQVVWWRSGGEAGGSLKAFLQGFHELLPPSALRDFTLRELKTLMGGREDVDVGAMQSGVRYTDGLTAESAQAKWFWRILRSFSTSERQRVLLFITGSSCVPADGFEPPFTLTPDPTAHTDSLPVAHTCFNQLVLPLYGDEGTLRKKLVYAATHTQGFALH